MLGKTGSLSYKVSCEGGQTKKHMDQLSKRADEVEIYNTPVAEPSNLQITVEKTRSPHDMPLGFDSNHGDQSKDNTVDEPFKISPH